MVTAQVAAAAVLWESMAGKSEEYPEIQELGLLDLEEAGKDRTSRYSGWKWIGKQINEKQKRRRQETGRREAMAESRQALRKIFDAKCSQGLENEAEAVACSFLYFGRSREMFVDSFKQELLVGPWAGPNSHFGISRAFIFIN